MSIIIQKSVALLVLLLLVLPGPLLIWVKMGLLTLSFTLYVVSPNARIARGLLLYFYAFVLFWGISYFAAAEHFHALQIVRNVLFIAVFCALIFLLANTGLIEESGYFKTCLGGCLAYLAFKFGILGALELELMEYGWFIEKFRENFPSSSFRNYSDSYFFTRVVTSTDLILALVLALYLMIPAHTKGLPPAIYHLVLWALIAGVVLTYTRLYWLVLVISVMYALFYGGVRARISLVLGGSIIFSLITIVSLLWGIPDSLVNVAHAVTTRFGDVYSLILKLEQSSYFISAIAEKPFFGVGLGGYLADYSRSEYQVFQYENQWLAITLQVGLIGSIFLILLLLVPFFFQNSMKRRGSFIHLMLYLVFLGSGVLNPNLTVASSALVYAYFLSFRRAGRCGRGYCVSHSRAEFSDRDRCNKNITSKFKVAEFSGTRK